MENLLDLLIGLALLYLLTAVAASFIVEFGASWTNRRAAGLKRAIIRLLGEENQSTPDAGKAPATEKTSDAGKAPATDDKKHTWAAKLYQHWLIQALHSPPLLTRGAASEPSYIPSLTYAATVLDLLRDALKQPKGQPLDLAKVREKLKETGNDLPPGLADALNSAFSKGIDSLQALEKELAGQFDAAMDRASGWYKRATQRILMVVALVLAVCFNLDTFYIAQRLLQDEALRSSAVGAARLVNPGDGSRSLDDLTAALRVRTTVLDKNVDAVKALKATKEAAARSVNLAALQRLQADNYFDPHQARMDYQLLTTSDPQKRNEAFAALFTPADLAACPKSTQPAGTEPGADAGLCDWLRHIDASKDGPRDAAIVKFSATGIPSSLKGRVLSPQLGWLTAAAIRAPESEAPLKALQDYLKDNAEYSKQLDASLTAALSRLPKIGWIGDVCSQLEWTALFGWLATALMAGFGAPFWFELLGKLVNLRGVGIKPAPAAKPGVKT
ncbi:hypothetical protein [Zoogloea sp.]|uniref:hypothetical protein n=1 Tax=Zoogloea sp. TaxID=49181 RepID=UPI0035B395C3